ncbi:hypothetical protein ACI3ER_12085 [Bacillus sp. Wb]
MWWFKRLSDGKEFMLISANSKYINGTAKDGERCSLLSGEWDHLVKK